jgi:hypothetical protein
MNQDQSIPVRARFLKHKSITNGPSEGQVTKRRICWPKDLLPGDLPAARIITYGYRGEVARFLKPSSKHTLFTIGQDLVTRLQSLRNKDEEVHFPLGE